MIPRTPQRWSECCGFTLVELGVTVAIIAILSVLLLPALGKMGAGAAVAQCTANLRQVHMAYMADTQEHDMSIPRSNNDPERGYSTTWIDYYYSSLGGNWQDPMGGASSAAVAGCPAHRKKQRLGPYRRTYSINLRLTDNDLLRSGDPGPRLARFEHPGQTALLADGALKANGSMEGGFSYDKMPDPLHQGRASLLFLDGHVELWSSARLNSVKSLPNGGGTPVTIFWKGV